MADYVGGGGSGGGVQCGARVPMGGGHLSRRERGMELLVVNSERVGG